MSVHVVCSHCLKVNRIPKKSSYTKANCGSCKESLLNCKPYSADTDALNVFLANAELPVVVDFWAPWCGPCLQMAPAFEEASKKMSLQAQFLKVNTEEQQALGGKYGIQSIPTLILFKGGEEIDRVSGALSATRLENWVKQHI